MIEYQVSIALANTPVEKRVTVGKGRLRIDVPMHSFHAANMNFNSAAEAFAVSLNDQLHRKFAYQYFDYLQDIARGWEQSKPSVSGRPDCRLIASELERIFRCCFFRPDQLMP
jgi:hypothetical protein